MLREWLYVFLTSESIYYTAKNFNNCRVFHIRPVSTLYRLIPDTTFVRNATAMQEKHFCTVRTALVR